MAADRAQRHTIVLSATVMCAVAISVSVLRESTLPLHAQTSSGALTIEADASAARLLSRLQQAAGGAQLLASVRSLSLTTTRTLDTGTSYSSAFRMLLPTSFQEIGLATYTVDGDAYWQRPNPAEQRLAVARRNKRRQFAEWTMLLLLRSPSVMPLKGTLVDTTWQGSPHQGVRVVGPEGFDYTFVVDDRDLIIGYFHDEQYSSNRKVSVVRRSVTVEERLTRDGLTFPRLLHEEIAGFRSRITVDALELNPPMTRAFFSEPPR